MSEARTHHDGPQSNRNRLDSVISLQATESVAVHDVLQVLVKCFAEIATRTAAAKLLPGQYTVLVSGHESQQWWHNRVILDGRMPRLKQRDLRAMIPWSTSHAEEVQVQILSLRFDVCPE